jgi:hypothetical protein
LSLQVQAAGTPGQVACVVVLHRGAGLGLQRRSQPQVGAVDVAAGGHGAAAGAVAAPDEDGAAAERVLDLHRQAFGVRDVGMASSPGVSQAWELVL